MVKASTGKQRRSRLENLPKKAKKQVERHGIARYSIG